MKKINLSSKLYLKKKKIASLNLKSVTGGFRPSDSDPQTIDTSLGKQSTCPIETCTCIAADTDSIRL